ncbi:MAG: GntR family transcriptional regulator [Acidimicrobiia bacterium]|nr:GntR family transcriptional regulator [Acidimicrobiia bacterium]
MTSQAIYLDIAAYLRDLVARGQPGDLLPSDAELCERFDVSRMTARQAVQLLVHEHLVERRRGLGTFIATRRIPRALGSPLSFTESMRQRGLTTTSVILEWRRTSAPEEAAEALGLDQGDPVQVLERVRLADGVPMALERALIPTAIADLIGDDDLKGSLHDSFTRAGHPPSRAAAEVSARLSTEYEQEHLELEPLSVVLTEERTIYDESGVALENTATTYAADRYSFTAMLFPAKRDGGTR